MFSPTSSFFFCTLFFSLSFLLSSFLFAACIRRLALFFSFACRFPPHFVSLLFVAASIPLCTHITQHAPALGTTFLSLPPFLHQHQAPTFLSVRHTHHHLRESLAVLCFFSAPPHLQDRIFSFLLLLSSSYFAQLVDTAPSSSAIKALSAYFLFFIFCPACSHASIITSHQSALFFLFCPTLSYFFFFRISSNILKDYIFVFIFFNLGRRIILLGNASCISLSRLITHQR